MFSGVYWNQAVCLSVCVYPSLCPPVCLSMCLSVQNTSFCQSAGRGINPFPDNKNLTWSKLKVFAVDKINIILMIISVFDRIENIVGKGENAVYQHFLLFLQCFEKTSFPDRSKGAVVWEWVKSHLVTTLVSYYSVSLKSCQRAQLQHTLPAAVTAEFRFHGQFFVQFLQTRGG